MNFVKGMFASVWSNGTEIHTPATLSPETQSLRCESVDADVDGVLTGEYFTPKGGGIEDRKSVCMVCHSYLMKDTVCSDPECESYE